jgi:hypothetical protein
MEKMEKMMNMKKMKRVGVPLRASLVMVVVVLKLEGRAVS